MMTVSVVQSCSREGQQFSRIQIRSGVAAQARLGYDLHTVGDIGVIHVDSSTQGIALRSMI